MWTMYVSYQQYNAARQDKSSKKGLIALHIFAG